MADSFEAWRKKRRNLLEIENPRAQCGHCHFTSRLTGTWTVENGRLVFRADANPLSHRGPDFHSCGESEEVTEFKRITVDDKELTAEEVVALQAAEQAADEAHWKEIEGG